VTLKKEELAYIAGFLDGDGCIMLQLINRKDYKLGYQIRASIVFYQKTEKREFFLG
jgi:intein-encoded DNA endonuclease-like protein